MRHRIFPAVVALLASGLVAAPSWAQSDTDRATARALAHDGEQALGSRDFAKALDLYTRADSLVHAPTLSLAIAHSQLGLGKLIAAQETLARIVREGAAPGSPPAFAKAVDSARDELAALQPRLPTVVLVVSGAPNPTVSIDDTAVPPAALGVKRPVDPGKHVARAKADGFQAPDETFNVAEGANITVKLELKPSQGAAPVAAQPPVTPAPTPAAGPAQEPASPRPPPAASSGSTQRTLGFISAGVGGAGLVVGAITGILAIGDRSTATKDCGAGKAGACNTDNSSLNTVGAISTVGFVAGGVFAAGGVALIVTAPKTSAPTTGWISPFLAPGYAGVKGAF